MKAKAPDPLVSVVVPNYNYAGYLEKRLDTIMAQTFQDIEIIFIDDASTDNSLAILGKYLSDPRLKTIINKTNSGNLFKNWNSGVKEARGKYIWIAEADDYADHRFLELLVEQLEQNPLAGIAYCQSLKVNEANQILGSMLDYTKDLDENRWKNDFKNSGQHECIHYLIFKNTIPNASAVLFRKDIYVEAGYARESVYYGNDWLTWVAMLLRSDIVFLAEPLNYYREHPQSVRDRMDMTENEIQASFLVLEYIHREMKPDKVLLNRALKNWLKNWVNILYRGKGRINTTMNRDILKQVKQIDPGVEWRWMKEMLIFPINLVWKKAFSLLNKIKKSQNTVNGIQE
jgi:glycosyltransferase involved in cell wall biosynthesis